MTFLFKYYFAQYSTACIDHYWLHTIIPLPLHTILPLPTTGSCYERFKVSWLAQAYDYNLVLNITNPRPTSFPTIAKEELTCPKCYELMKAPNIPKYLPGCEHVICEVCIHCMMVEIQSGKEKEEEAVVIICPECRSTNTVPSEGGSASFKTNMRLRNLARRKTKRLRDPEIATIIKQC